MVRVLVQLLAAHPAWLLAHAQGYADLALEQATLTSATWQRRVLLQLAALGCALLGAGLAGVAAMLWAIAPQATGERLWVLLATPALPLVLALVLWLAARGLARPAGLAMIKLQWQTDMALLRGSPTP
ncbi:hypothetical protein [Hydrogenophaga sp. OTU3427]|uniref:hypothetical protein n=1 Tax=Hydrogenophaga sp. OTU3427 TaxID=3043856 RepID=UPI00313C6DF0